MATSVMRTTRTTMSRIIRLEQSSYVRLGGLAVVIIWSLAGWWKYFMSHDWVALVATVVGGWPIFEEAWRNLRKRRMTMELSMTIALIAALCIGQFFTALVIAFFVLFAELLEERSARVGVQSKS